MNILRLRNIYRVYSRVGLPGDKERKAILVSGTNFENSVLWEGSPAAMGIPGSSKPRPQGYVKFISST